jgi:Zn-dependent peptidase ImmA (M78 family)
VSRNEQVARSRAESFRVEHDLGTRPLGDLFELAHTALGCDTLAIDADEAEHGLSMLDPDTGRVVIVVATTPHLMRQRSSLAHEIGHVVAGDLYARTAPTPGTRSPAEIQADAFARHVLLPVGALHSRFGAPARPAPSAVGEADLAAVVQEFEVSPGLAAIQFKEAGLIRQRTCTDWAATTASSLATRYGWLSQYQALSLASSRPRAPQALMRRAVEGYHRGVVGIAELASWYGQPPEQLLEQLGPARNMAAVGIGEARADDLAEDTPLFPPGFSGTARTPTS